jgi:outer membrane receptor protein involved in Fe transport
MSGSGYKAYAWFGASHQGPATNEPRNFLPGDTPLCGSNPTVTTTCLFPIPSFTTYDGAVGVVKDQWSAEVNVQNLTDEYGPTNVTSGQFIKAEIPLRPRVVMFQMGYHF